MQNKSSLLNIVLAVVVVVLVFQLTKRGGDKKHHHGDRSTHHKPSQERVSSANDTDYSGNQKKSVGVKGYIMPKPALVIGSYSKEGKPDIMTAAWTGIANSDPLSISVSIRESRMTYENILANGCFTVNVPSERFVVETDYVGNISGRDEDKFKKLGLTPVKGDHVNAPYIGEFPIVIECEVTDTFHLGSHVQFIGKVVDTKVDVQFLDENEDVDIEKLKPVIFEKNFYYGYGKRLAKPFDVYKTLIEGKEPQYNPLSITNETLVTIFNRKSVRHFTSEQVSQDQLTMMVRAGMAAPTAVDKRPWAFVAIQEREVLDQLADILPYAKMLKQATGAIVVCGDLSKALQGDAQPYWVQDCSAATQNILLAAESMGLGAVWTGVHPIKDREKDVQQALNIPSDKIPLSVIAIGYPTGEDKPKDKWDETNLHWNKW
ncbi:flavin reductase [Plebeiibacterium marinum]|uniref:Nitroreductase family protein n=1 Tax=Plebeiibacterium marinum TaxID=2992111 RepID=A0AAE3MF39_9BACT|nr:flavin reductase [Plebeiobacterium marinum]MCW3806808.1 nitroreductase family protein [Plebeiobacterium marinum]